jgi:hypothetical protein
MVAPSTAMEFAMTVLAYAKPRRRSVAARPAPKTAAPPSGDLINAILQYADVMQDQGGGRTLLRLSARRMADPVIAGPLGREAPRLAEVAILWDDEEDEICRVLDAAHGDRLGALIQAVEDEAALELTDEALAYLKAHGR